MSEVAQFALFIITIVLLGLHKLNAYLMKTTLHGNFRIAFANMVLFWLFNFLGVILGTIWGAFHGYLWLIGILFIFPASALSGILSSLFIIIAIIIQGKVYPNIPYEIKEYAYFEKIKPNLDEQEESAFSSIYTHYNKEGLYRLNLKNNELHRKTISDFFSKTTNTSLENVETIIKSENSDVDIKVKCPRCNYVFRIMSSEFDKKEKHLCPKCKKQIKKNDINVIE
jgi:hypothetical protein